MPNTGTMYTNAVTDLYGEETASEGINVDDTNRFIVYCKASTCTGTLPVNVNGYLFTIVRAAETKLQFYIPAASGDSVYVRRRWSGTWDSWGRILIGVISQS